jgi:hyperosmotically inducible protein
VITAAINAELARDHQLGASSVSVDTVEGRVTLRGDAPDLDSRDRAARIAQDVDGVKSVDNQISIRASS